MFAMARSSYEINAGLDLTPVLNRRLLKNLAREIDAPPRLLFKDLRYLFYGSNKKVFLFLDNYIKIMYDFNYPARC